MRIVSDRLRVWGSDIEEGTIRQAEKSARLPIIEGHVALMPDAHIGIGATVGSVIPTRGSVIPSAVGVDIGCGMIASETSLTAADLPDDLSGLLGPIEKAVPAGVGRGHEAATSGADRWFRDHRPHSTLSPKQITKATTQLGTLGAGNHFVEVCLDEGEQVWLVLHSGSRGIGNQLAQGHIAKARTMAAALERSLEDPDLAWFTQGTPEFDHYIGDMLWAQDYARVNRAAMMQALQSTFFGFVGAGREIRQINCHHNFTQQETHADKVLWITRKGAIKADVGDWGVIPGSMGTRSYIVEGRGNAASWRSCSHGAGRRLSRTAAKRGYTVEDLAEQMQGKVWLHERAASLLDEIPGAYKDIDRVMADQTDLVRVDRTLHQILNYKG